MPGNSSANPCRSGVSSANTVRKITPLEASAATTAAPRWAAGPIPPPMASPVTTVDAISVAPRITRTTSPRPRAFRPLGCCTRGTSQISANARPSATVTPRPAHSAPTSPTASAIPLPVSGLSSPRSCEPITGMRASAESTTSRRRSGLSSSTNPRIETNASSSGNSEKNA